MSFDINDIARFCAKSLENKRLQNPWQQVVTIEGHCRGENKLIACDGSIAIVADITEEPPNIESVFSEIDSAGPWLPFPEVEYCKKCNNTGVIHVNCDICNGSGQHQCSCGDDHDCCQCDGVGTTEEGCKYCQFTIEKDDGKLLTIKGYDMRRIIDLPDVKYGVPRAGYRSIYIMFDGGIGKVVAMDADDS